MEQSTIRTVRSGDLESPAADSLPVRTRTDAPLFINVTGDRPASTRNM
jgi:hypothetical protein